MRWTKYGKHEGPKHVGDNWVKLPEDPTNWDRVFSVVASAEGNYDTVIGYDGTGITFGAGQWTFTSGRLQKFLRHLQGTPSEWSMLNGMPGSVYDAHFVDYHDDFTVDDPVGPSFKRYGFLFDGKNLTDLDGETLDPRDRKDRSRIVKICGGGELKRATQNQRREHHMALASLFQFAGEDEECHTAQRTFAQKEYEGMLDPKRPPLGEVGTIRNLLGGDTNGRLAAIFFNLMQNNPKQAFKMFLAARKAKDYEAAVWRKLESSAFGNWGYKSKRVIETGREPRFLKVKKAIERYYE